MRCLFTTLVLLVLPSILDAKIVKWEGKPIPVSISTERLTRIEFPENLRSVFLSRSDIAVEREDKSLYVRALAPEIEDTLFVVGENGTTYELILSTSDNPDHSVVISYIPKSLKAQAEQARQVPALDLMRSMMRGLPVDGYEIIRANKKEVYRDAFFSMKLVEAYRSPVLHGYVIEVENLAEFPVLLRVQDIDFAGMVAISSADEFLQPRSKKASEVVQERFRTYLYIVAVPTRSLVKE
jgi:TraK protein